MSEVFGNFIPGATPLPWEVRVGEQGGMVFGIACWSAGNTKLYTSFGYVPGYPTRWGSNRRSKKRAIAEATRAFVAACKQQAMFTGNSGGGND